MAERPATLTQPLTRAQLAEFVGTNPRALRAFEAFVRDLSETLPDAAMANSAAAEAAQASADAAQVTADEALAQAEGSAQGADTAMALAQAGLAEVARLWAAVGSGGGGGGVVAGLVTVTVPPYSYFHAQSVVLVGCTAAMRLVASIAPHDDADENSEELLVVQALTARAGTDAATVSIAFAEPTTGPVKINLMAA